MTYLMVGIVVVAVVFVLLGALIYHIAHKTTLGASITAQVAAEAKTQITALADAAAKKL